MVKFDGPGPYRIVSYGGPDLAANSWGGTSNPEDVKLYPKEPMSDNQTWCFSKVKEDGDNSEYVILNCRNGLFLKGNSNNAVVRSENGNPKDPKCRWTLKYTLEQGRYDCYWINCVDQSCGRLNVAGDIQKVGTQVLSYKNDTGGNTKWYLDRQPL